MLQVGHGAGGRRGRLRGRRQCRSPLPPKPPSGKGACSGCNPHGEERGVPNGAFQVQLLIGEVVEDRLEDLRKLPRVTQ